MEAWQKYGIQVNDWDRLLSIKFQENTKPEGVYCDVGACSGVITSFFKKLSGESGLVYSFELNPFNFESIKHLQSENCIVENLGISDESGYVDIYGDGSESGNHVSNIIGYDTSYRKMNVIGNVKSISLDEYFSDKQVDYIKIDVEGAELRVIKGGLNTLKKCKFAVIECHFSSDWLDIYNVLKNNGLDFRNIVDDVPIYYGNTVSRPGIGENGMPYQIYLKNN
jgi:FkbM family methyltransferase